MPGYGAVVAAAVAPTPASSGTRGDATAVSLATAEVTVVVVTYQSDAIIAACLAGIPRECPVHVVDNASRDGTLARIKTVARPGLRVTRMARNEGFGRACNRALCEVATDQALLLNPDAAIAPEALARLSAAMGAASDVAILAPTVVETLPVPSDPAAASELLATGGSVALLDVPEVAASCMLLDMNKLRRIGFFDENIFLYYEDSDLCRRAREAGFRVCIAADAVALHRSGASSSELRPGDLLRERLLGQGYAYFTAKHHPQPRRRITRKALAYLTAGIGSLAAGRTERARSRFARMRGILEFMICGRRALWVNRLAGGWRVGAAEPTPSTSRPDRSTISTR